jgi:hypothetical protein
MSVIESPLHIQHCCLFLPMMKSIGLPTTSDEPIYTVIDSDWTNIQANKSFSNPYIEDILQSIFSLKF